MAKQTKLPWSVSGQGRSADSGHLAWMFEESAWQSDPSWKRYVAELADFSGKLKILDLCGGLGTGFMALSLVLPRGCVESGGIWDIDSDLSRFLGCIHDDSKNLHLGKVCGDLMKWNIEDIAYGHIIVAGPPCPPWSKLGKQKSFEDHRSHVFWRVVDIVVYQAKYGFLGLFVLENVESIRHKTSGSEASASDTILKELREELPDGWNVDIVSLNSASYGLPQSRHRAYIIGHRRDLFEGKDIAYTLAFEGTVTLAHLLDESDQQEVTCGTDLQMLNLNDWKEHYRSAVMDTAANGSFAVFDVSRTPADRTAWQGRGNIDKVQCLTASGPLLHVLSLGGGSARDFTLDRRLRGPERARLQGMPPVICNVANETAYTKSVIGNAMTVPVIGSIFASELSLMYKHCSITAIADWCNGHCRTLGGHCRAPELVHSSAPAASTVVDTFQDESPSKRLRTDEAGVVR